MWNTCRFCRATAHPSRLVKYGTRHYAHPACYLDSGRPLEELSDWQLGRLPYALLKERGLLDRVAGILAEREAKEAQRQAPKGDAA